MGCCQTSTVAKNVEIARHLPPDTDKPKAVDSITVNVSPDPPKNIQEIRHEVQTPVNPKPIPQDRITESPQPITSQSPNKNEVKAGVQISGQLGCIVDFLLKSEMMMETIMDEDLLAQVKDANSPSESLQTLKTIMQTFKKSKPEEGVGQIESQLNKSKHDEVPAFRVFSNLLTAFYLIKSQGSDSKVSIKERLLQLIELLDKDPEITKLLLELAKDKLGTVGDSNAHPSKAALLKKIENCSEKEIWPFPQCLPKFYANLMQFQFRPEGDLKPELGSLIQNFRYRVYQELGAKDYDSALLGPSKYEFGPMSYFVFKCTPALSFAYVGFDDSKLLARVKRITLKIYEEPKNETTNFIEFIDNISVGGQRLQYHDPIYKAVSVSNIVKKISETENNPNLVTDFDPVFLYHHDDTICYSLAKEMLLDKDVNIANLPMFRILLFKNKDIYDESTLKVAFSPRSHEVDAKTLNYLFVLKRDQTLQTILDQLKSFITNLEDAEGSNTYQKFLNSFLFRDGIKPLQDKDLLSLHSLSHNLVNEKGWNTTIGSICDKLKIQKQKAVSNSVRKADLIICLNQGSFKRNLDVGNSEDAQEVIFPGKKKVPKIKPGVSEYFSQFIGQAAKENKSNFTEYFLRDVLPQYLYVDVSKICTMVDLSPEIKMTYLDGFAEHLELGTTYKAIGYSVEEKSKEGVKTVVNYFSDTRNPSQVISANSNRAVKLHQLDATMVKGIYYERRVKQL